MFQVFILNIDRYIITLGIEDKGKQKGNRTIVIEDAEDSRQFRVILSQGLHTQVWCEDPG